jgi:hypothetical protein
VEGLHGLGISQGVPELLQRGIEEMGYNKIAFLVFGGHSVASPLAWLIRFDITQAS